MCLCGAKPRKLMGIFAELFPLLQDDFCSVIKELVERAQDKQNKGLTPPVNLDNGGMACQGLACHNS